MNTKKITYHIQKIAVWLLMLTVLGSCQLHELTDDCDKKGLLVLHLGVDGMTTRASSLFTGDEEIVKYRVFVFANGFLEINQVFSTDDVEFNNFALIEVAVGMKEIYVVANETAEMASSLGAVTAKDGLISILANQITSPSPSPLSLPLVMAGKSDGDVEVVEQPDTENPISVSITLTRIASKISLRFNKDTGSTVTITKVSLIKNTGKTTIWENGTLSETQSYWDWNHTLPVALTLTETPASIPDQGSIYLYENLGNSVSNKENATQLEVEALFDGIQTKYRVYINEDIDSPGTGIPGEPNSSVVYVNDHFYNLKRNYHYQLNGKIKNIGEFDGLTLTTNVLPWNVLESSISFERIFTISPSPTLANHTYPVDGNGEVKFTFKLTSPIDASWVANLTDITNFELVGAYQGVTDDEVVLTIKAKNDAGEEVRTTEFYINAEYGGNWAEIPLLSGSDLIGAGNRVVIRQPAN